MACQVILSLKVVKKAPFGDCRLTDNLLQSSAGKPFIQHQFLSHLQNFFPRGITFITHFMFLSLGSGDIYYTDGIFLL